MQVPLPVTVEAIAALTAIERADPWPENAGSPSYLLAEVAAKTDPAEAIAAAERFRRQWPRGLWRSWAYPRSLIISAQSAHRLGDRNAADEYFRRLDELASEADPGSGLRSEVAAVRARLTAVGRGR